ncbi:MAG: glycosyltransferase [Winogradskyella sp.]|uniref:ArnT family glycosyltransferase n=1 Tax=Winogradskyella sp. TaxID=1883156 RepID=UPI0017D8661B|nr:glycosyltransferase [Winogradskyella sp.]
MIKVIENNPILSLLLFVAIMLGFTIDAIPVSIMEARNFISAREMLTDGNWILTTMNGEARYEKPPLPTWITAAFGYVFGMQSVLALRWPALFFLASIGISTFLISRRLELNSSHSVINGFIVITSFYCIGITIEAPWDIYTHGFMLMALYQLLIMLKDQQTSFINSFLFVLFMSCTILSKGPVSLYVLFLSFSLAFGFTYKFQGGLIHYLKLFALLIFGIVLGGWWYLHVRVADPVTFSAIAERETSNWSSYNVRPFYYYWSFFVQSGMWAIPAFISLLYPYLKSRVSNIKAYRFSLLWTLIALVLLSIIPEKKSRYLMPVLIPLAINIGFYINYLIRTFKTLKSKKEIAPVYFSFGLLGLLALLFWVTGFFLGPLLTGFILVRYLMASIALAIIGFFIFKELKAKNIKNVFYLSLTVMLGLGFFALPLIKAQNQELYTPVSELNSESLSIYSLGYVAPEVIFNYGNKIPSIKTNEGYILPEDKEFGLLTREVNPNDIDALSKLYTIEYVKTFDLNFTPESTNSYKNRLVNQYYKLSLK